MQCSVDDETFISTMNVGSSYSQEYLSQQYASQQDDADFEVDEDGEGFDGCIERYGGQLHHRRAHSTMQNMVQCGHGSGVGTDQTRYTYWVRMEKFFDKYNKSGIEHTHRSLRSR
jgi:hypothetical protein